MCKNLEFFNKVRKSSSKRTFLAFELFRSHFLRYWTWKISFFVYVLLVTAAAAASFHRSLLNKTTNHGTLLMGFYEMFLSTLENTRLLLREDGVVSRSRCETPFLEPSSRSSKHHPDQYQWTVRSNFWGWGSLANVGLK